jgi:hypothetical protein
MEENKMTREQYFGLKNELKEMAQKIRTTKVDFKSSQRAYSIFSRDNGSYNAYFKGLINSSKWESIRPESEKLSSNQFKLMGPLYKLKEDYRYKHICYCLARGRALSQIEQKVRKGNELSMNLLKSYLKRYELDEALVLEKV